MLTARPTEAATKVGKVLAAATKGNVERKSAGGVSSKIYNEKSDDYVSDDSSDDISDGESDDEVSGKKFGGRVSSKIYNEKSDDYSSDDISDGESDGEVSGKKSGVGVSGKSSNKVSSKIYNEKSDGYVSDDSSDDISDGESNCEITDKKFGGRVSSKIYKEKSDGYVSDGESDGEVSGKKSGVGVSDKTNNKRARLEYDIDADRRLAIKLQNEENYAAGIAPICYDPLPGKNAKKLHCPSVPGYYDGDWAAQIDPEVFPKKNERRAGATYKKFTKKLVLPPGINEMVIQSGRVQRQVRADGNCGLHIVIANCHKQYRKLVDYDCADGAPEEILRLVKKYRESIQEEMRRDIGSFKPGLIDEVAKGDLYAERVAYLARTVNRCIAIIEVYETQKGSLGDNCNVCVGVPSNDTKLGDRTKRFTVYFNGTCNLQLPLLANEVIFFKKAGVVKNRDLKSVGSAIAAVMNKKDTIVGVLDQNTRHFFDLRYEQ
jgi:hypothetical protein